MSNETIILALRLQGPMQSWGFNSQFNRRDTGLFPTKSALVGLCCAAMGLDRGSEKEKNVLALFVNTKLTCIAIPCIQRNMDIAVKRIQDYHTVQNTRDAKGGMKNDAVLTYRQYLNDAGFVALIEGNKEFLGQIAESLKNPVWGVWLGRKACIPSAPVFAGLFTNQTEAVGKLVEFKGKPIENFSHVIEVDSFGNGIDSYMDQVVSFDIHKRQFAPRRVMLQEAKA